MLRHFISQNLEYSIDATMPLLRNHHRMVRARPQGGAFGAKPPQNFCLTPPNFSGLKFQWLMIEKYDGKEYQTSPFAINYFRKLLR